MYMFAEYRAAAEWAATTLRHTVIKAEDFGASPSSPQQVCLAGVRAADIVVLILGQRYGAVQPSGLSATHEEYREARNEQKAILVFVQEGVTREPKQSEFVTEARTWNAGAFTASFSTVEG